MILTMNFHAFRYGLIIPKTSRPGSGKVGKSASIFQNDSSEEDEVNK